MRLSDSRPLLVIAKLFLAFLAAGFLLTAAAPAQAVESVDVVAADDKDDAAKKKEEDKKKAQAAGRKAVQGKLCGGLKDKIVLPGVKDVVEGKCKDVVASYFTLDWVMDADEQMLCKSVGDKMPVDADIFAAACTKALNAAQISFDWVQKTFKAAYDKALDAAKKVVKAVELIKDPKYGYQFFFNDIKKGLDKFTTQAFDFINKTTSFQGDEEWWRSTYGVTAGLGIFALVLLWLKTWADSAHGFLEPGEVGTAIYPWGLVAFVIFFFGPPFMYVFAKFSNALATGVLSWMGTDVAEIGTVIMALIGAMGTNVIPGGLLVGVLLLLTVALSIVSLLLFFGVQYVASYIFGSVLGTAVAGLGHPNYRQKALLAIALFIALLLARPAYLVVLGVLAKFVKGWAGDTTIGGMWASDPIGALWRVFSIAICLLIMSIAPAVVLKFFPLMPDASTVGRGAVISGTTGGALAGAGVSGMNAMMMQRRMSANQQSDGSSIAPSGDSGKKSTGQSATAPATAGTSGKDAAATVGKVGAKSSQASGLGAKAGASSGGGAAASGGSAAASGTGAAAAGSGAATARVGAAAVMAADMGVKTVTGAHAKAKSMAESAAPDNDQGSA